MSAASPGPIMSEKKPSIHHYSEPQQQESAQMGQGSQVASFENVDVNPFIV